MFLNLGQIGLYPCFPSKSVQAAILKDDDGDSLDDDDGSPFKQDSK